MDVKRGLLRLWIVASAIWALGVGALAITISGGEFFKGPIFDKSAAILSCAKQATLKLGNPRLAYNADKNQVIAYINGDWWDIEQNQLIQADSGERAESPSAGPWLKYQKGPPSFGYADQLLNPELARTGSADLLERASEQFRTCRSAPPWGEIYNLIYVLLLLAIPPLFVFLLGASVLWAFKGFRPS